MADATPLEGFLKFLSIIEDSARRGYGSTDILVDLFLASGRRSDGDRALQIRLLGPGTPGSSPKASWSVTAAELRDHQLDAAEYVAATVERLARLLTETRR